MRWTIPLSDGYDPIEITIRSERVVPPCLFVDLKMPTRLLTPVEAAQLAQMLQDASRDAAQLGTKARRR